MNLFNLDEIAKRNSITTDQLKQWCKNNLTGNFLIGKTALCIESEADAMAFILRWW